MGNVPDRERGHRRRADGNQKAYDLGNDRLHRLTMRPEWLVFQRAGLGDRVDDQAISSKNAIRHAMLRAPVINCTVQPVVGLFPIESFSDSQFKQPYLLRAAPSELNSQGRAKE